MYETNYTFSRSSDSKKFNDDDEKKSVENLANSNSENVLIPLKINKSRNLNDSTSDVIKNHLIVGRFPLDSNLLTSTNISIHKDVIQDFDLLSSSLDEKSIRELKNNAAWRFQSKSIDEKKKNFFSRKEKVDTKNYFVLLKNPDKNYAELFPVSNWYTFETDIQAKAKHLVSTDETEEHSISNRLKEKSINEKDNLNPSDISDDEGRGYRKNENSISDTIDPKNNHLRTKKNAKSKKLALKASDYVESAISLTELRSNEVTWDYENDGYNSDDEELEVNDTKGDDYYSSNVQGDFQGRDFDDVLNDDDDANIDPYVQNVSNLLKKQEENEQEDELNQYKTDDDDDENYDGSTVINKSNTETNQPSSNNFNSNISSINSTRHTSSKQNNPQMNNNPQRDSTNDDMTQKVIRVLTQNMGRMNVKDFMSSFKVKQKNEEFKSLQKTIQKICCISTEDLNGQKIKYVNLKSEYRR